MISESDVFENKGITRRVLEKEPAIHIGFCCMIPGFSPMVAKVDLFSVMEFGRVLYAIMLIGLIR